ncbi:unnamed protein product [Schistosoma margrebowiei]|uniref:Uncharacterized protein n=1 Tax=Schistosoma margrebowiei TaxID=48269 RepID=A0A183MJQ4_9TREM|nr:unnamed protein product [Schistosoma margrebowiei]
MIGEKESRGLNTAFPQHTDKLNEFKTTIDIRFQALKDLKEEETTMEDNGKGIKKVSTSTCRRFWTASRIIIRNESL